MKYQSIYQLNFVCDKIEEETYQMAMTQSTLLYCVQNFGLYKVGVQ